MPRATGSLERSLQALTLGIAAGQRRRAQSDAGAATGEYTQQVRTALSGIATNDWSHVDKKVTWQLPFLNAPMQRTLPFERPHFQAAFEMSDSKDTLIVLTAALVEWTYSPRGWIVGATIRFASHAPTLANGDTHAWQGTAHLSFQGYCAYPETGT